MLCLLSAPYAAIARQFLRRRLRGGRWLGHVALVSLYAAMSCAMSVWNVRERCWVARPYSGGKARGEGNSRGQGQQKMVVAAVKCFASGGEGVIDYAVQSVPYEKKLCRSLVSMERRFGSGPASISVVVAPRRAPLGASHLQHFPFLPSTLPRTLPLPCRLPSPSIRGPTSPVE